MIRVLIVTTMMVMPFVLFAQFDGYVPSTPPVTPVAYQFLKYLENPVDEYHGIPEISIPIYTIEAGSIKLPIILRYHAGGIRVAEEASWVGLGWNLELGTITQIINDRDDFGNFQKELPDYLEYATPYDYPMEYLYPWTIHNDYNVPRS